MTLRALIAMLALALAGCPTPGQSGGLAEVDVAGFAARMRALCRSGIGAQAGQGACPGSGDAAAADGGAFRDGNVSDAGVDMATADAGD
jgi:hypothetical protein